jgi:hypothetical protein
MPFTCPDCQAQKSLYVIASIELPSDARWDEITLQMLKCDHCGQNVVGVYQESRRGGLDEEIFHHMAYRINEENTKKLKELMDTCLRPTDVHCPCKSHKELSRQDEQCQWNALELFGLGETFSLQL